MKGNHNGRNRKKKRVLLKRRRTLDPSLTIDYKNPDVLKRFITDRGKIIPRRISGATQEQQRKLTVAIKRARFLGLIACSPAHRTEKGFAGDMQNAIQTFVSASMRGSSRGSRFDRGGDRSEKAEGADASARPPKDTEKKQED